MLEIGGMSYWGTSGTGTALSIKFGQCWYRFVAFDLKKSPGIIRRKCSGNRKVEQFKDEQCAFLRNRCSPSPKECSSFSGYSFQKLDNIALGEAVLLRYSSTYEFYWRAKL